MLIREQMHAMGVPTVFNHLEQLCVGLLLPHHLPESLLLALSWPQSSSRLCSGRPFSSALSFAVPDVLSGRPRLALGLACRLSFI